MRYLAVLQIAPGARRENIAGQQSEGVVDITVGDWVIRAALDTQSEPLLSIHDRSESTSLLYEGGHDPVFVEAVNGKEERHVARPVVPWAMEQSMLRQSAR